MYQVKPDSVCGQCNMGGHCDTYNIPDGSVFINMVTGVKYAFVHDCSECGCMCEIEEQVSLKEKDKNESEKL